MKKQNVDLYRDNALAHSLLLVHEFLVRDEMTLIPQLLYSPDMISADFIFVCS